MELGGIWVELGESGRNQEEPGRTGRTWEELGGNRVNLGGTGWIWEEPGRTRRNWEETW